MIDRKRIKHRVSLMRPLLLPLILYIGLLAVAVSLVPEMQNTPWRYVVAVLPMVPGLFLAIGIIRLTTQIDEMERRILLEAVAFSFVLTLLLLLTIGLLGLAGVPQPSPIIIATIMCFLLLLGKLLANWKYG